jgi:hypothetical protein
VGRGEMPIEPGDSWFSPKCIEVQPQVLVNGGKALDGLGGKKLTNSNQTMNAISLNLGVRLWGISSVVERETAQTIS